MPRPGTSTKPNRKTAPLDRYAGQWVAFANGKVVAHQSTFKGLMEKVKGLKKVRRPSVMLVPRKEEWPHV
jgi:hypothetical protein